MPLHAARLLRTPRPRFARIHEIDHFRRGTLSWHFDLPTRLLLPQKLFQRIFVMILELVRNCYPITRARSLALHTIGFAT